MLITGREKIRLRRGFTLLELLLVVTLLGVMTAVVLPRMRRSVRARGLTEGAEEMASFVRFARAEAMRRSLRTRLKVSADRLEYWIEMQDPEGAGQEQYTRFGDALLDSRRRLPQGVRVDAILEEQRDTRAAPIVFTPDGVSASYSIELVDKMTRSLSIDIGPWYDEVTVARPEAGTPAAETL